MLFYLNHRGKEFKRFIDINSKCFSIKTLYNDITLYLFISVVKKYYSLWNECESTYEICLLVVGIAYNLCEYRQ